MNIKNFKLTSKEGLKIKTYKYLLSKIVLLVMLISLLTACMVNNQEINKDEKLEVHFIDVGQADSILLINSKQSMLIDAGDSGADKVIIPYLKSLGINKLDTVVFTHPHKDHIGSGKEIIENVMVDKVYMSGKITTTKTFEQLLDSIEAKNIELIIPKVGEKIDFGSCDITVLGPVKEYEEINDNSLVLKVKYYNTSFLFTGDIEEASEKDIINTAANLDVDVLKVAHHGSETSSSYLFLKEVNPKFSVVTCGVNNDYNHPHKKILDRLNDVGSEIYRTDLMGTIVALSDGENITFNQVGIKATQEHKNNDETNSVLENSYIGNINSKKLHLDSCGSLPAEKNRVYFKNRKEAIKLGYEPCSQCNP